jgi:phosphoribosylformylglycinamidine (FGAM) synthase-like enzyme
VTALEDFAAEYALFGERGARVVVSVSPEKLGALRNTARQYGVGAHEIGKVNRDNHLRIEYKGRVVVSSPVPVLRDAWAFALERALKVQ